MADDELARLRAELEAVRGQVAEKGTSVTRKANALAWMTASRGEGSVEGDTGSSVGDSAADRLGIASEELLALSSRAAGGAGDKLQADKRETPLWKRAFKKKKKRRDAVPYDSGSVASSGSSQASGSTQRTSASDGRADRGMERLANAVAVMHANGGSEGATSEKEKTQQAKAAKAKKAPDEGGGEEGRQGQGECQGQGQGEVLLPLEPLQEEDEGRVRPLAEGCQLQGKSVFSSVWVPSAITDRDSYNYQAA